MKAYFYAQSQNPVPHTEGPGIIAFSIPDLGFTYRQALRATPSEFPYRALLALIEFLENNRKVWQKQKLELCTDCAPFIYQVLGDMAAPARVRIPLGTIRLKKRQLGFTLHWVAPHENRTRENISQQPVSSQAPPLNFASLQDASSPKSQSWKQKPGSAPSPKT